MNDEEEEFQEKNIPNERLSKVKNKEHKNDGKE